MGLSITRLGILGVPFALLMAISPLHAKCSPQASATATPRVTPTPPNAPPATPTLTMVPTSSPTP